MIEQRRIVQSTQAGTLADLVERILDKGIVVAGDIRVNLVSVELLSIQIRLVICSVDKAREMGMDWWVNNPLFSPAARPAALAAASEQGLEARIAELEQRLAAAPAAVRPEARPAESGGR